MKNSILLLFILSLSFGLFAQKNKKQQQPLTGFAVTSAEKGGRSWKEVRMLNMSTGDEIRPVYNSKQELESLNARTGKPVQKKATTDENGIRRYSITESKAVQAPKKIVNLDQELDKAQGNRNVQVRTVYMVSHAAVQTHQPFATNSAAMAYDKKHDRLYYTPMGINQLRYIDMKSGKIYFFEDEAFGTVKGLHDAPSQITRMVIASDGNGYALSNDGNHLIRFTTGKNPVITDLGALTDDAANGNNSVHNRGFYGGDMVADASKNLYLITANRRVFKISIDSKTASYLGVISGLPAGFSTNGAMVEEGSKVIVASSENTSGYYRFDLNNLEAEKISTAGAVFNASDLANGNLAFAKTKKKKNNTVQPEPAKPEEVRIAGMTEEKIERPGRINIFPNPVVAGESLRLSFAEQPEGKYQVQLLDLSGRVIRTQEFKINSKSQLGEFAVPQIAKGSYLLRVTNTSKNISVSSTIMVQ